MFGNLFRYDSPLSKWIMRMCDLVVLNLLTILCCIPIFTAGAAISALHYCTMRMSCDEESRITADFFHAFKNHFGQSAALTGIYLGTGGLILFCIYIFHHVDFGIWDGLRYVLYIALIAHMVLFTYVFAVFARFDNTVGKTLKNSYILAVSYPVNSAVVTITNGLWLIVMILWPALFWKISFIWVIIGFALQSWWSAGFFRRIFDQLTPVQADPRP